VHSSFLTTNNRGKRPLVLFKFQSKEFACALLLFLATFMLQSLSPPTALVAAAAADSVAAAAAATAAAAPCEHGDFFWGGDPWALQPLATVTLALLVAVAAAAGGCWKHCHCGHHNLLGQPRKASILHAVAHGHWSSCSWLLEQLLVATAPLATGLKIVYHQDFAPPDIPTALAFAPPMPYYKHFSSQTLLLIAGVQ